MTKTNRMRGLALGTLLLLGTALAAVPANGLTLRQVVAKLIDTNIVVGFPQHAPLPTGIGAAGARGPTITEQPVSQSVASGAHVSFTATATGLGNPRVQWRDSTNGGSSWSSISGATSTTYSFTASASENGYQYDAVFSGLFGSTTTSSATLTVTGSGTGSGSGNTAPSITQQPSNESVSSGSTASFAAAASGTPTPTVQWQQSTNGGSAWTNIANATSTTYSFSASSGQNGYEYRAVFSNVVSNATTNAATLTVTSSTPSLAQSSNWSGYANDSGTFSSVSGTWTVPTVSCSSRSTSYSAQWIGIDGYSSNTVEQDGTEADCSRGSPSYDAWYEMYGDNSVNNGYEVELSPSTNPVSPGDVITASVSVSGSTWTLSLTSSRGWNFSTNVTYSGAARSSAEWIVERPEVCNLYCALTTLANFGSVAFSSASSSLGSISATAYQGMEMVNGSTPLAVPSALSGSGFTDTWENAG